MKQETFTIEADSGEAFGEFRSYALAHAWLIRQGLGFEPLRIVSLGCGATKPENPALTSLCSGGWSIRPNPLRELERRSLAYSH